MIRGFIFDLDGVLVDTPKLHYQAWRRLAKTIGIEFTEVQNEQLKGVGREASLHRILQWGNKTFSPEETADLLRQKNEWYLEMLHEYYREITKPGVKEFLEKTKQLGLAIALASASKNARHVLEITGLTDRFEAIVDGNQISLTKPLPQIFIQAANALDLPPSSLLVIEDAQAGIEAARHGGFWCLGIGEPHALRDAHLVLPNLKHMDPKDIMRHLIG